MPESCGNYLKNCNYDVGTSIICPGSLKFISDYGIQVINLLKKKISKFILDKRNTGDISLINNCNEIQGTTKNQMSLRPSSTEPLVFLLTIMYSQWWSIFCFYVLILISDVLFVYSVPTNRSSHLRSTLLFEPELLPHVVCSYVRTGVQSTRVALLWTNF